MPGTCNPEMGCTCISTSVRKKGSNYFILHGRGSFLPECFFFFFFFFFFFWYPCIPDILNEMVCKDVCEEIAGSSGCERRHSIP